MPTLFHSPSKWPVLGEYDVAVVGAGPGGIGAALAGARSGARTVLIERAGYPGGMATQSNCFHIMGFGVEGRQVVGGIADELVRRMNSTGDAYLQTPEWTPDHRSMEGRDLDNEVIVTDHGMRLHANRMFAESGVRLQYYTSMIGAVVEDGRITAVAVDCAEGPCLIEAKTFVDATGDANLVYRAGGACIEAPVEQSMTKTLLIDVGGVTEFDRVSSKKRYRELFEAGKAPFQAQDRLMAIKCIEPGVVHLNFTLTAGSGLRSDELTRMDVELREQISVAVSWFRKHMPRFRDCYLVRSAHVVGVRGGRCAVGLETITTDAVDADRPAEEPVAVNKRHYGGHSLERFDPPWRQAHRGTYQIPWKALLSESFSNLALAGRSISADPRVLDVFRLMAPCVAVGEAAGITAALAAHAGSSLVDVGYPAVRGALLAGGAVVEKPEPAVP